MLAKPGLKRAASLLVGAATGGYVPRLSSAGGDAARSSARGSDVVRPRGSVTGSCLITGDGRRLAGSVTDLVRGDSSADIFSRMAMSVVGALMG
jgi:hypothetical protein